MDEESIEPVEPTCYAHTATRIILKLIRRIVPEIFTPFINDEY